MSYPFLPPDMRAQCLNVVDGDTVDLLVDLSHHAYRKERYRLLGIDAYELSSKIEDERKLAQQAKAKLIEWLRPPADKNQAHMDSWALRITTAKDPDSFGRYLVDIYMKTEGLERHVNQELVNLGLARPYRR